MELLDDLDIGVIKARTFRKEIDVEITHDEEFQDTQDINEEDGTDGNSDRPVIQALDFTRSSLLNISLGTAADSALSAPSAGKNSSVSFLERVKRRLNGEAMPEEEDTSDTQPISQEGSAKSDERETQAIEQETPFVGQEIDSTQPNPQLPESDQDGTETQVVDSLIDGYDDIDAQTQAIVGGGNQDDDSEDERIVPTTRKIRVFENEDEDDNNVNYNKTAFLKPSDDTTQLSQQYGSQQDSELAPTSNIRQDLFLSESEDEETPQNIAQAKDGVSQKEERQKKIEERTAKKKTERLLANQNAKDKENKKLDSNKALRDELDADGEEDDDDRHYYSGEEKSRYDEYTIQIPAVNLKKFDKSALFKAFGVADNGKVSETDLVLSDKNEDTPNTSPQKSPPKEKSNQIDLSSSDSDDDDDDAFDAQKLLRAPEIKSKQKSPPVFNLNLKEPEQEKQDIELDDDDSDDDIEIKHSKSAMLDFKAMLSKKKSEKRDKPKTNNPAFLSRKQLWGELQKANRLQLKKEQSLNPELPKEKELLQKESMSVEDLLQKHIEHNNRIRQKEEEMEKWRREATAIGSDDEDYGDEEDDGEVDEVPESDFDDDESIADDEAEAEGHPNDVKAKKSRRKMVIEDDEEADESEELKANLAKESGSNISLGVFGGNLTQSFETNAQKIKEKLGYSISQLYDKGSQSQKKAAGDIFDKLRNPKIDSIEEDDIEGSQLEKAFTFSLSQNEQRFDDDIQVTPLDDVEPPSPLRITQKDSIEPTAVDAEDDEDEAATQRDFVATKRLTKRRVDESDSDADEDEEEQEESEEQKLQRMKEVEEMKQRRRAYEKEQLRKKREMKSKGLDKIMEAEAEESEDEWHGIGGAEGEGSDDENSEDEKMFDDFSKFKSNRAELAQKLAAEDAISDKKMVDRILYDVEHGKLARRGHNGDGDLDFSDGEDETMRTYRALNQLRYREQLEKDEALRQLAKDKRSKAFFESITQDSLLDSRNDIFNGEETDDSEDDNEDTNPFNDAPKRDEFKDPSTITKKKKKITERFVQKQLSFISNTDEDMEDLTRKRRFSDAIDDEFNDDLSSLKQNSIIKIPDKTPQKRKVVDLELNNPDTSPSNFFKMPSLISKSFQKLDPKSFNSNEVTVSTSYKTASSSKSSIMSFGRRSEETSKAVELRQNHRVLKVKKVSKIVQNGNRLKSFDGSGDFD